jgi:hypothetical protein
MRRSGAVGRRGDPSTDCTRLNLDVRQHVAAIGRRASTLCKHEAGLRQQLTLFHACHNFVLPHGGGADGSGLESERSPPVWRCPVAPITDGLRASPFNMCFEFAKLLPHVKIP